MLAKKQPYLIKIELFDEFRPQKESASMAADEKSLAFRLTLVNDQETLQDAQVEAVVHALLSALQKDCAASSYAIKPRDLDAIPKLER